MFAGRVYRALLATMDLPDGVARALEHGTVFENTVIHVMLRENWE